MASLLDKDTVIVLGAGATKAFLPDAPLGIDDFNLSGLSTRFENFSHAKALLDAESARFKNGRIDIEQLMTRLHGPMPYDNEDAKSQYAHLLSELRIEFIDRINRAKKGSLYKESLARFAKTCIENEVTFITFNYDDVLDQALWEAECAVQTPGVITVFRHPYWHPDGGYGLFIPPSDETILGGRSHMDKTRLVLLKLHGSINWYPRKGSYPPYKLNDIYHHEDWYKARMPGALRGMEDQVSRHLELIPFFVPPVLDKRALSNEPILQVIWTLAKEYLSRATRIFFVGYSMPLTDLASRYLFVESLKKDSHVIRVINCAENDEDRDAIIRNFRKSFPDLTDDQFEFSGALHWAEQIQGKN